MGEVQDEADRQIAREREWRKQWAEQAKEWEGRSAQARELGDEWHKRWSLSLAVANGAAFVGVTSFLLDPSKHPQNLFVGDALLFAAWSFAIGGALAGSLPLVRASYFREQSKWAEIIAREQGEGGGTTQIWSGEPHDEPEMSDDLLNRYGSARDRYRKRMEWFERVAAIAFGLGIVAPLAIVTSVALR
ncbi:MAG: hypothetical protein DCF16_17260 [Alphaproteobacteria bacterium]|nr:MAG: hypothetical protein DCF16_17260 [Alphaproteobacteria bacterium]